MSIVYTCNTYFCNALVHVIYSVVSWSMFSYTTITDHSLSIGPRFRVIIIRVQSATMVTNVTYCIKSLLFLHSVFNILSCMLESKVRYFLIPTESLQTH